MEQLDNKTGEELKAQEGDMVQNSANEEKKDYDSLECRIERLKEDIEALKRIKHQQKKLDKLEEKKLEILKEIERTKGKGGHHKRDVKRSKH